MQRPATLVVFFSRTGHTRQLADDVGAGLSGAVERLMPGLPDPSLLGDLLMFGCAALGLCERFAVLPDTDPAAYRLLVIASPVWFGRAAPPIRAFLKRHGDRLGAIAVALSCRTPPGDSPFDDVARLVGRPPVERLWVSDADRLAGNAPEKTFDFVDRLERWLAVPQPVPAARR